MDLFSFGPFLCWWIPNYDLPFVRETYKLKDILFLTFVWPVNGFLVLLNSGWECSLMIQGGGGAIRVVHWRVVTVVHDGSCRIQELYQDLTGFEVFLPAKK